MKPIPRKTPQAVYIRAVNRAGTLLGERVPSLSPEILQQRARRKTGLEDFGDPEFLAGLQQLADGLEHEASLSPVGRIVARFNLVDHLCVRLRLIEYRKRRAQVSDQQITRPLFILGLPRTGTTILYELIAQDPSMRAPSSWEVTSPLPPPQTSSYLSDRRIRRVGALLPILEKLTPGFRTIHAVGAQLPQECVYLLASHFLSEQFSYMYHLPSYRRWLLQQDMHGSYRWHRQFLQHLQVDCAAEHWVLKSPAHLPHLQTLLDTYPDAGIVWTHRKPLQAMASFSSLTTTLQAGFSHRVDPAGNGQLEMEHHGHATRMAMAQRDQVGDEQMQILDISFRSICDDPLTVIEAIYQRFGYTLSDEAARRMRSYLAARPRHLYGRHRYSAKEFGLDSAAEEKFFGQYLARYGTYLG